MPSINIAHCCIMLLLLFGCRTASVYSGPEIPHDNKYDSEFPSKSVSNELSYISKTVKKLDILAFYATYCFPSGSNISKNSLNDSILEAYSDGMTITNESASGTASVIYCNNHLIGLVNMHTCC